MTEASGPSFLTALQLADSFFPTGMYAHSHGLEGMAARGWVSNPREVGDFLHNLLAWSVMPADGVALLNAHAAARDARLSELVDIDRHLHAMKLPVESRLASCHAGRRLLDESDALLSGPDGSTVRSDFRSLVARRETPGTGAVAMGVVAHAGGIAADTALLMFCHSFAVGVLGAAQRLLPLSHSDAQLILRSLHAPMASLAAELQSRHWREMTSFTPQADIAVMLHENDDVRMFAS